MIEKKGRVRHPSCLNFLLLAGCYCRNLHQLAFSHDVSPYLELMLTLSLHYVLGLSVLYYYFFVISFSDRSINGVTFYTFFLQVSILIWIPEFTSESLALSVGFTERRYLLTHHVLTKHQGTKQSAANLL